ncbi:helix-turn-helix domain-containing protein [Bacteroidales bacterium OttesenSCG-928-I14]|nr:helix-turn-helix domain-containing protein [Bacteroidales bacterium OttesenSCG-928-I14]
MSAIDFYIAPLSSKTLKKADESNQSIEIVLVSSGYAVRECNFNNIRINAQEIHLSIGDSPYCVEEKDTNVEGWYCSFSPLFLRSIAPHEHLISEIELISSFLFQYPLRLSASVFERIKTDMTFIYQLYSKKTPEYFLIYVYLLACIYEIKKVMQESHLDFYPAKAFSITKDYSQLLNRYIEKEYQISFYAKKLNISPNHLNKSIKAVTGKTAISLLNEMRLNEAKQRLKNTDMPVSEIAFQLGFEDPSYFSRFFKKKTGVSPVEFREDC